MADDNVRLGDAAQIVGGDAAALMVNLMERNHIENENLMNSFYEGEVAAHQRTKDQLHAAYAQLDLINHRLMWLMGEVHTTFPVIES